MAPAALLDPILERALSGPPPTITARTVYTFAQSPFAVWCERFAPASEKDELDEYTKMLFEQGRAHEARTLAARYPDAASISAASEEDAFRAALAAMSEGAAAIAGVPLFWLPEGLHGRADLLVRRDDAPSAFGPWHYVVKEIKLAKNIKDHHVLQAALYNRVLGHLQGYVPAHVEIVDRDGRERQHAYDAAGLLATLRAIRAIHDGTIVPAPVLGEGAWPWESYTDARAIASRDVSLVAGVGPAMRAKLASAGFATIDAAAAADRDALCAIRGIGERTAEKIVRNASALVRGTHIPLGRPEFRPCATEVFLDLEGTGAQLSEEGIVEVDYLIGAWVRDARGERYERFLAATPDDEGAMFHAFTAWLAKLDDPVVYHWSAYERTHLRRLAERHGIEPEASALLAARMRDLLSDARESFAFPTYGNSIKKIAPYCGFSWRHKGVGAMTSIAHYFAYVADPIGARDRLQLVLDYNEDDCIAMRVVKDWLVANAAPTPR